MKSPLSLVITAALMFCGLSAYGAETVTNPIGKVIFHIGQSAIASDGQAVSQIKKEQDLEVGQVIRTGHNGHVHIRFIDNAFVSVRPNSELVIEEYLVDEQHPQHNRIKFNLKQGTSRLITGKGGHANKSSFRLNTPVAAIGVRGTDFVVQTDSSVTRVAVQQGGVAVSPFHRDCAAQNLGPCKGDLVRDLMGSLTGNYLEVRGQMAAQLITPANGKQPFALPRPEEPSVIKNAEAIPAITNLGNNSSFMWGRWAGSATAPTGYELVGQNDAFALFRIIEQQIFPTTAGFIQFKLDNVTAYGKYDNQPFRPAEIDNAKFAVNFERREFNTSFDWRFDNHNKEFYSQGRISSDGRLLDDPSKSNMSFSGALSENGNTAAYIFSNRFNSENLRAYGVTRWSR